MPHHEHRRMLVVLIVVLAVAVGVCFWFLWSNIREQDNNSVSLPVAGNEQIDPVVELLNNSVVEITEQEKTDAASNLTKSVVPVTEEQKEMIAESLKQVE